MEQEITITQPTHKKIYRTISAQAKSWIAMVGFAFSSILCETNTQGLPELGEYQAYRGTQTSVPVLCNGMTINHLQSVQSCLGPGFSRPLKISILCSLPLPLPDCSSSLEAKARLSGPWALLLAALSFFCAPKVWITLRKPYYWIKICFGLTELLCFFINHNTGHQCILKRFLKTNIHYKLESDSGLFWYVYELNLRTLYQSAKLIKYEDSWNLKDTHTTGFSYAPSLRTETTLDS